MDLSWFHELSHYLVRLSTNLKRVMSLLVTLEDLETNRGDSA